MSRFRGFSCSFTVLALAWGALPGSGFAAAPTGPARAQALVEAKAEAAKVGAAKAGAAKAAAVKAALLKAAVSKPARLKAAMLKAALSKPAQLQPALLKAAVSKPALLKAALLKAALLQGARLKTVPPQAAADSDSDLGPELALKMQLESDRRTKANQAASNALKKQHDSETGIISNVK